ncbi:beta-1,4 N-acetylgalactosaminyltransferase 2-like isoform X2 [Dicentrarchus labrax]|uniref:Glycosyltransferase 2-like domain-containing protein n=2 Tax=Dicentrarchus labrax TaxID=13489 RepID=A0A8P4K1I0_DICLA|nr:beta-1,4 N-acetylgalactosaminyltransferase 2-like isoform X2 [Dicentrarchus labrax]XP_051251085.1 beta-1,4 N-acetylgalactosaminyltransferase 2-like isoform X2 [Dicentrarchus labrax]XP_051251086.1 beta-1,4 N-acetylgalactosaminyltransferase 2-like isoform X2 [Dicentrarchus labrax]
MAVFQKPSLQLAAVVCVILVLTCYFIIFYNCPGELLKEEVPSTQELRLGPLTTPPSPGPCTCAPGSVLLKDCVPKDQYEELVKRRAKEFQQQKARSPSELSKLLFALPNSPLQYPTQGFTVRPLTPTLIPGLALHAGHRSSYKVSLHVSKGILTTEIPSEGVKIQGHGETKLIIESSSLVILNNLLAKVSYTSTVYHIHTGDLASFQFDKHEAVFPITIKQPQVPVLYDMGTDISSQVTITTKTFLRYRQLKVLLNSIRSFYSNIEVIIADDSFEPEHITGEHIQQYIMPPAQGWFAGRNLAISQVTTKYFLWVDDDFVFTQDTKIEKLVEVMESVPELDVLGGKVDGNQFYFYLHYEEGEEMEGGCLDRKSKQKFHPLPGYPQCSLASGVVNFFLARTDAVQRVRFDPKLKRVAHSEFFMDGLGSLLVASCGHVSIGHQPHSAQNKDEARYVSFRHPQKSDEDFKHQLHFFKNHLKCVRYG